MPLAAGVACHMCGTVMALQVTYHADGRITDYPYCPHCDRADCPTGCRICRTIPRRNY